VVVPSRAVVPERGEVVCIGAQLAARSGDGGAVRAGGVEGPGGACALATLVAAVNTHESKNARFVPMGRKRPALAVVPQDANGTEHIPPGWRTGNTAHPPVVALLRLSLANSASR
jgi:hypothetical protein